jgi:ribonucleoside-diphosphate reductase alpha chain
LAYEKGCKGLTLFRDGCKRAGILTTHEEEKPCTDGW